MFRDFVSESSPEVKRITRKLSGHPITSRVGWDTHVLQNKRVCVATIPCIFHRNNTAYVDAWASCLESQQHGDFSCAVFFVKLLYWCTMLTYKPTWPIKINNDIILFRNSVSGLVSGPNKVTKILSITQLPVCSEEWGNHTTCVRLIDTRIYRWWTLRIQVTWLVIKCDWQNQATHIDKWKIKFNDRPPWLGATFCEHTLKLEFVIWKRPCSVLPCPDAHVWITIRPGDGIRSPCLQIIGMVYGINKPKCHKLFFCINVTSSKSYTDLKYIQNARTHSIFSIEPSMYTCTVSPIKYEQGCCIVNIIWTFEISVNHLSNLVMVDEVTLRDISKQYLY